MSERVLRVDLHSHTDASSDAPYAPLSSMVTVAKERNLDVLGITDHNAVGSLLGLNRMLLEELEGIEVLEGVELSLDTGHYLIFGISPERMHAQMETWGIVPTREGRSFICPDPSKEEDYLSWAVDQGGVIIAAHPGIPSLKTSPYWMSTSPERLYRYSQKGIIHGAEAHNVRLEKRAKEKYKASGSFIYLGWHLQVMTLLKALQIPAYANSDAHEIEEVGLRNNTITFSSEDTLLEALREKRVEVSFNNIQD